MLLVMEQQLEVGGYQFPAVMEVILDSSRNTPTDTLTVKLPRYRNLKKDQIKPGQPVRWSAGYKQTGLFPEFQGKVFKVQPREPIEFECRDDMSGLAATRLQSNFYLAPLADVIGRCAAGIPSEIRVASPLPISIRCQGKSARFALWELRRVYGYDCYFQSGRLIVEDGAQPTEQSMRFVIPARDPALRSNNYSGVSFIIEDQLELAGSTRSVRITVESEDRKTGVVQRASAGAGTEEIKIVADGLTGAALQKRAQAALAATQGSFSGSFKTFGSPPLAHSMQIQITDENEPARSGLARVDRVVKTFSGEQGSYRQEVHVSRAVA
ncbi:MAG: hypothetical protein HS115_11785 [Spirochaetales bacterium]|nr:hypothetical protein [Spirochaetales bacterium]